MEAKVTVTLCMGDSIYEVALELKEEDLKAISTLTEKPCTDCGENCNATHRLDDLEY